MLHPRGEVLPEGVVMLV